MSTQSVFFVKNWYHKNFFKCIITWYFFTHKFWWLMFQLKIVRYQIIIIVYYLLFTDEKLDETRESLTLHQESFTVPESDPSQLSQSMLHESDLSKVSQPVIPISDQSKMSRPILGDLDSNIPTSDTKKQIGIVVTGLNVSQIVSVFKYCTVCVVIIC